MIDSTLPLRVKTANPVDSFLAGREAKNALAMQQAQLDAIPIRNKLADTQLKTAEDALASQTQTNELRDDALAAMKARSLLNNPEAAMGFIGERIASIGDGDSSGERMVFDLIRSGNVEQAGKALDEIIRMGVAGGAVKSTDTSLRDQLTALDLTIKANEETRKQELADNRREDRAAQKQAEERARLEGQKELDTQNRATREQAAFASKNIERLLSDDLYKSHFGSYQWRKFNPVSAGSRQDAKALVDQVVGMVTVDARGKLKGQGTITDTETQLLANAETILSNPDITEELALAELMRVDAVYKNAARRANGEDVGDIDLEALDAQIASKLGGNRPSRRERRNRGNAQFKSSTGINFTVSG